MNRSIYALYAENSHSNVNLTLRDRRNGASWDRWDHRSTILVNVNPPFLKSLAVKTSKKPPRIDAALSAVFLLNEFINFIQV